MPITEHLPADMQANEAFKGFDSVESLAKGYLDLHGKTSSGSMELLSEELRKDPSMANFKSVTDVAKGFIETKKLVGTIKKAPEKIDGYKLSELKDLHPSLSKANPETQKAFLETAHKMGLAPDQADGLHGWFMQTMNDAIKKGEVSRNERAQAVETELRKDWAGDYDKNYQAVERLVVAAGGPEAAAAFGNLGKSPVVLKTLGRIAKLLSEDSIKSLGANPEGSGSGDAAKKIATVLADKAHPYHNEKDPKHADAVAEVRKLYQEAYNAKN